MIFLARYTSNLDTELAGEEEQQKNPINRQVADFTNDNVFICFTILGTVHHMFLCINQ
jgi:hypothetical protein